LNALIADGATMSARPETIVPEAAPVIKLFRPKFQYPWLFAGGVPDTV
jgi:hypothetical protein